MILAALAMTGCKDRAVTLSEITEQAEGAQGADSTASAASSQSDTVICVYICGAVVSPGVYELPGGSRICDGLEAAGGFHSVYSANQMNCKADKNISRKHLLYRLYQ